MKLVMLMYLEEDDGCVERLLGEAEVPVYSRLPLEGVGDGAAGWYGSVPVYRSRMAMAVVEEETAGRILAAVEECRGVADRRHPIRALQMDVETLTACGSRSGSDPSRTSDYEV